MAAEQESRWFRLPKTVTPLHYDLLIKTDLKTLRFQGVVTTKLKAEQNVDTIELNAAQLHLSKAQLTVIESSASPSPQLADIEVNEQFGRAVVKLGRTLQAGTVALLSVAFWADIARNQMGYYASSSVEDGVKTTYALTQFAPTCARRTFPCWDEPAVKVGCAFKMIHRADTVALANMPVQSSRPITHDEQAQLLRHDELQLDLPTITEEAGSAAAAEEWTLTAFEDAPKMSSYLLTWANGPFDFLESSHTSARTGKTIPLRIYATKSQVAQARFALDVKAKVLPIYEELFGIDFPLPKLDTLVVSDFAFGAMEGFGLITGRTTAFLFDETKAGLAAQRLSAEVQTHEIAHQWFGNMITFEWWTSLWLNESFATLMGCVTVLDRIYPEWKVRSLFINGQLARALELDAKRSSHPIEVPLRGDDIEDGVNQIFDAISYAKGGSVLNMLANMVGEDVFLKGVEHYLRKHIWSNAKTEDLWAGISEASGIDVAQVMHAWIHEQGFPLITVTEQDDGLLVRQNRFLITGDVRPEEDETLWYVPLALRFVDESGTVKTDQSVVLDRQRELRIPFPNAHNRIWKLNADTIGVYRVAYSPERLRKLGEVAAQPTQTAFTLEDRVGLVSDAITLARAGYGRTSAAFGLMWELRAEPSYLVNDAIASALVALSSVWFEQEPKVKDGLKKLRASIFGPLARRLGFASAQDELSETRDLRQTAVTAAAAADDAWTLDECQRRFAPLLDPKAPHDDEHQIPKDLMQPIFQTVVRRGGVSEYEAVLRIYRTTDVPSKKQAALQGLCAASDLSLLQRTIDLCFNGDVRKQDWLVVFNGMGANPLARRMWWTTVKERFDGIFDAFSTSPSLSRIVEAAMGRLTKEEDLDDVKGFFKGRDTNKYSMGLQQGLESIRSNHAWLTRDATDVQDWLLANGFIE